MIKTNVDSDKIGEKPTINVMLVDDHALVLDGLVARLELESHVHIVGSATNGQEALELAASLNPDVVLMDVSMPVMNGIEAARCFNAQLPNIKVLMLSMHDDREYILSLVQSGAAGYVLKDVSARELVTAIETVHGGGSYFSAGASKSLFSTPKQEPIKELDDTSALSKRELDVLKELAQGHSNKEVARSLNISIRTVETHRQNIKQKLDIHTTAGLTRYAIECGLVD